MVAVNPAFTVLLGSDDIHYTRCLHPVAFII